MTNSVYGTDEVLWKSANGLWSIWHRKVYTYHGEFERESYSIYSRHDGVMWPINHSTAENTFYPKYVRRAIARHCPKETL